jgi:hypothetical protein
MNFQPKVDSKRREAKKNEGRGVNQRNCWRGARSVSPDISPRLSAFVPTTMRRLRIGLSRKIILLFLSLGEPTSRFVEPLAPAYLNRPIRLVLE